MEEQKTKKKKFIEHEGRVERGEVGLFWEGVGTYYARKACSGEVVGDWMQYRSTWYLVAMVVLYGCGLYGCGLYGCGLWVVVVVVVVVVLLLLLVLLTC